MNRLILCIPLLAFSGCELRDQAAIDHACQQFANIKSAAKGQQLGARMDVTSASIIKAAEAGLKVLGGEYRE